MACVCAHTEWPVLPQEEQRTSHWQFQAVASSAPWPVGHSTPSMQFKVNFVCLPRVPHECSGWLTVTASTFCAFVQHVLSVHYGKTLANKSPTLNLSRGLQFLSCQQCLWHRVAGETK